MAMQAYIHVTLLATSRPTPGAMGMMLTQIQGNSAVPLRSKLWKVQLFCTEQHKQAISIPAGQLYWHKSPFQFIERDDSGLWLLRSHLK